MKRSKIDIYRIILLIVTILFLFFAIFLNEYIEIPKIVIVILLVNVFVVQGILGLISHKVYITRSKPWEYGDSIFGVIFNLFFCVIGIIMMFIIILL